MELAHITAHLTVSLSLTYRYIPTRGLSLTYNLLPRVGFSFAHVDRASWSNATGLPYALKSSYPTNETLHGGTRTVDSFYISQSVLE